MSARYQPWRSGVEDQRSNKGSQVNGVQLQSAKLCVGWKRKDLGPLTERSFARSVKVLYNRIKTQTTWPMSKTEYSQGTRKLLDFPNGMFR